MVEPQAEHLYAVLLHRLIFIDGTLDPCVFIRLTRLEIEDGFMPATHGEHSISPFRYVGSVLLRGGLCECITLYYHGVISTDLLYSWKLMSGVNKVIH